MKENRLTLLNIHKNYTQAGQIIPVLQGVSQDFEQGKTYAITGLSGSGKSTLIHVLAGLDTPTSGHVMYKGIQLNKQTAEQRTHFLRADVGLVFQFPYLIRELTVSENIAIKGMLAGESKNEVKQRVEQLLKQVGLIDKKNSLPGQLSGGQQQRVAIVRALISRPAFLIADEPTGSLDVHTGSEIVELLLHLQKTWHMGLIISSHEPYVFQRMGTVLELENGVLQIKK